VVLGRQFHLLPFAADTVTYIICMRRTGLYRQVYEKKMSMSETATCKI